LVEFCYRSLARAPFCTYDGDRKVYSSSIFMSLSAIKFSSEDCGICHKMSFYDRQVAEELGLNFIDVKMQDTNTYRQYRRILLAQYPNKTDMGWPTYIVCKSPEGEFEILGEVKGGHPKGEFRTKLQAIVGTNPSS
jgi:hypothetical protein